MVEIIVAVTILMIITLSVFFVYADIIRANRKLEMQRLLQENARNITEGLATEIRTNGIDFGYYDGTTGPTLNYGAGNDLLAIKGAALTRYYCMTDGTDCKNDAWCRSNPRTCYLGDLNGSSTRLSDETVEVTNLRFYLSGKPTGSEYGNQDTAGKATIVFDLAIAPGEGVDQPLRDATKMHIQTTISEMYYKK